MFNAITEFYGSADVRNACAVILTIKHNTSNRVYGWILHDFTSVINCVIISQGAAHIVMNFRRKHRLNAIILCNNK